MLLIILFLIPLVFFIYTRTRNAASRKNYPLPPGPKKLPIVENLFNIPRGGFLWREYDQMCRRYGSDIIHFSALGNSIVVLNSQKAVNDLLEKRSAIYSSRPPSVMLGELVGWGATFVLRPNDDIWKAQRKIVSQAMPPGDPQRFYAKQLSATHDLLRVLPHLDDAMDGLQTWAAVFIMDVVYGIRREEAKSYAPTALAVVESAGLAAAPGAFYVEQIPMLKYVPEWFPGADFQRKAREWSVLRVEMTETAFGVTKEQLANGTATPSLASVALEQIDPEQDSKYQEEIIKHASVTAFGGGTDTIVITVRAFILAMLQHPEIQVKAHRELTKVLGPGDLPTFSDEPSLPYITAITREVLRHNPTSPLAFPHQLTQDDIYEGYFLPKGSIIMPNAWSILHSEEDYPEPERFSPERFLDADGKLNPNIKDPGSVAFGFGRRVCPGKHVAIASLWIAAASILTCYTIEPELDENGKEVPPKGEWYSGPTLLNRPLSFKCRFIPRSKDVQASLGMNLS